MLHSATTMCVMKPAIILPTMPAGANPEGIEAAAETAERLGWQTAWTTDHILVPHATEPSYGTIFDVIVTLAWVGARHPGLALGTSVIVVPMRNAVVLAKELATLDSLVGGRLTVGVGVGWNETEFANVGMAGNFHQRGAYLDETMALWRHLWSGATAPFVGRFHEFTDYVFGPLPDRRGALPIVIGGRSEAALRRTATIGDGLHFSAMTPSALADHLARLSGLLAAGGRGPMPITGRVGVQFGDRQEAGVAITGSPDEMRGHVQAYADLGVDELAFSFGETDAERARNAIERFDRDVLAAFR